jgi:hypothetical protein
MRIARRMLDHTRADLDEALTDCRELGRRQRLIAGMRVRSGSRAGMPASKPAQTKSLSPVCGGASVIHIRHL